MSTIKGLNIKIGADATSFNKAIDDINKNVKGLNREVNSLNRDLKFDPKNPELMAQKTKVLGERVNETAEKLNKLKLAQNEVNKAYAEGKINDDEYRKFQNEIVQTESKLKGFEEQFKKAQKEMLKYDGVLGQITTTLEDTGQKMQETGQKLSKYSLVASGALVAVGKAAIDFDSAWVGVQKTMSDDITPEQLANIKDGIKDMSKEIGVSTTEIAGVAESAGQLGIQTENILDFTRVMVDMGKATNLSSDVAATTLARFANVTKMSQADFSKLGSTIVALGNNFATTEAEIASMSMNLGSAGAQIGMSHSDIVALATALSSVGLEAQAGGTAFSKVMIQMQLAVETSSEKLADFANVAGMSADEFADKFKNNATGALQNFILGLSKSEEQGSSAIKVLDDLGITETRLRDALLRSANASDIFTNAIDMGSKAWEENNALQAEASQRYDSVEGKWNKAKESLNVLAINLGDKLLPYISDFFDGVSNVVDKFGNLNDGTQKFILGVTSLVAVGGPALILGGKAITGLGKITGALNLGAKTLGLIKPASALASGAMATVGTTATATTASTGLLATAFTKTTAAIVGLNPATIAVTAGIAAVAGTGLYLKNKLDKEVIPSVDLFADHIGQTKITLEEFGEVNSATIVRISDETKEAVGAYMELSDGVLEQFNRLYLGVDEMTEENVSNLKNKTNEMVDSILDKNTERKNEELSILSDLFANSKDMSEEQKTNINNIISQDYNAREEKTKKLKTELHKLYEDMAKDAEGGTTKQKERVTEILNELNTSAVTIMSKDEAERNIILNRMHDYGERITAEHASKIIQELENQKIKTIETASETRDEQVRIAEDIRARGGENAEQTADKIIKEANRQYQETVDLAEKGKKDAVGKLIEANESLSKSIDLESGKIKTGWDKLKTWWNNLVFPTKTATVSTVTSGGYGNDNYQLHNNGLYNVPYDGYKAILHRDERVLTKSENRQLKEDGYFGTPKLAEANQNISNIDNSTQISTFNLSGTYYIREESDIKKVAEELHKLTLRKARS